MDRTITTTGHIRPTGWLTARDRRALLYMASIVFDLAALLIAYLFVASIRDTQWLTAGGRNMALIGIPLFTMFSIAREVQSVPSIASRSLGFVRAISALVATALVMVLLSFIFKDENVSRAGYALFFISGTAGLAVSKFLLDLLAKSITGGRTTSKLLILDGTEAAPEVGMDIIDLGKAGIYLDLSAPDQIDIISNIVAPYDRVVVACPKDRRGQWATLLKGSDVGGEIVVPPAELQGAVGIGSCGRNDTLILSRGVLGFGSRFQKRTFDLVIAIPLMIFLAPLMAIVALAIRLDSPGPILFGQIRVGQGNRQFRVLKFRSMYHGMADKSGNRSASRSDDRITPVGRFIRRTSIDELPQLINVLRGDMSLVGPRPHALGSLAGDSLFWEVSERYWMRHALKPGITGLAQVRGFRGATTKPEDLEGRLKCDLEYVSTWSIWQDMIIMLRTVGVVVHPNAY